MHIPMPLAGLQTADLPHDAVEVGRITGAWGIKGWVKIQPYSGDPQALFYSPDWFLTAPQAPYARGFDAFAGTVATQVTEIKPHTDTVVAQLAGVPDRNAAEALKGVGIHVPRGAFPPAKDGEFYWVDLIGLTVVNREGETMGVVRELLATGPHSVLCLDYKDGEETAERLIPFVDAYVDQVDLKARTIVVDWQADY